MGRRLVAMPLAREHHQPLVVICSMFIFQLTSRDPIDISVSHRSKIRTTIGFNNDQIPDLNIKAGSFLCIINFSPCCLEGYHVQGLGPLGGIDACGTEPTRIPRYLTALRRG